MSDVLHASPLGKNSVYQAEYNPSLLFPVERKDKREALGIDPDHLPFYGRDLWYGYELSWLNRSGKPVVRVAQIELPCHSPCLIESKSFKLYLNSFNQSRFECAEQVADRLTEDLSAAAKAPVVVRLYTINEFETRAFDRAPGINIDELDVAIDCYQYDSSHLAKSPAGSKTVPSGNAISETLHTHLLKSNCPVTGQPDWGTLVVSYRGEPVDHASLLKYICSFRTHQEFHEQCVERAFVDLQKHYRLETLTVYAQYLRRGGLDINPWRSTVNMKPELLRFIRQ
ncbi:NADPH-dependent 7-cyano-7-deazaguanine reductase QueF [Endozoicomonas sp. SCSIO W0465]|uniref:NADPH-dependent 7-cyano-7-deazaguanine reductase QueF n=1 Tax=Endozoicomonas sp. SCSIO W0465 TaxID=2918516 RepID=UPI002074B7AE|nr:NADPH-dependent 7-cyano-7-deazaguanine reductase QueF [Endozoicomonas sp. SCSIO W0465]USE35654.1 NADPH-dependent 7-cyano-7-deazaguanine reductase QueF [Endozoicomonas sp. SCSIO W0465]